MDQMLSWNSFFQHLEVIGFDKLQHPIHIVFQIILPHIKIKHNFHKNFSKFSFLKTFPKYDFFIDVFISILKRIFPNYNRTLIAPFLILKTSKHTFTHFNTPTHIQAHDRRTLSNLQQKQPTNALLLFNIP